MLWSDALSGRSTRDPHNKQLGVYVCGNPHTGIEGMPVTLLTRFPRRSREEMLVFASQVRGPLKDRRVHAYTPIYVFTTGKRRCSWHRRDGR